MIFSFRYPKSITSISIIPSFHHSTIPLFHLSHTPTLLNRIPTFTAISDSNPRLKPSQPVRIGDHSHRAECHRCAGNQGRQQDAKNRVKQTGGHGDSQSVIEKSAEQVFTNVLHSRAGKLNRQHHALEAALDQGN